MGTKQSGAEVLVQSMMKERSCKLPSGVQSGVPTTNMFRTHQMFRKRKSSGRKCRSIVVNRGVLNHVRNFQAAEERRYSSWGCTGALRVDATSQNSHP